MPKYQITVEETLHHTYEIDLPERMDDEQAVIDLFYDLEPETREAALVSTDGILWTTLNVEEVGAS